MHIRVLKQLELQFPDMPDRIENFVTCLRVQATVVRQSVKLSDNLVTSIVHVFFLLLRVTVIDDLK